MLLPIGMALLSLCAFGYAMWAFNIRDFIAGIGLFVQSAVFFVVAGTQISISVSTVKLQGLSHRECSIRNS
jgi:hypothetical protein